MSIDDDIARPPAAPSDVLTWHLARRVMVDHGYDLGAVDGCCARCGESWPCGPWRRADDIARHLSPY